MADELLNAQDLITAKKHDTFHSEVITGKTGGLSTGANIDYATNAVTGQVQKTLPKVLDDLDWSYVGLFADGVTFTDKTDFAVDAVGTQWIYTGSLPFSATAGTVPSEPTYQAVHVKSASTISNANGGSVQDFIDDYEGFTASLLVGGSIYPEYGTLNVGDIIPSGTKYVRIQSGGENLIFMLSVATSGTVTSILDGSIVVGGNTVYLVSLPKTKRIALSQFGALLGAGIDKADGIQTAMEICAENGFTLLIDDEYYVGVRDRLMDDGVLTRPCCLYVPSNSRIEFLPGAKIKQVANNRDTTYVLNFYLKDNIKIWNPEVWGDKDEHTGVTGEYGHCYNVTSCSNITLVNPKAYNAWGDGFYIGLEFLSATTKHLDGVKIIGGVYDNISRNGVSFTSGKNTDIEIVKGGAVNRLPPMAGVDIEPEIGTSSPINPTFENCNLWLNTSNSLSGLLVFIGSQNILEKCELTVHSLSSYNDVAPLQLTKPIVSNISGLITIDSFKSINSRSSPILMRWAKDNLNVAVAATSLSNSNYDGPPLDPQNSSVLIDNIVGVNSGGFYFDKIVRSNCPNTPLLYNNKSTLPIEEVYLGFVDMRQPPEITANAGIMTRSTKVELVGNRPVTYFSVQSKEQGVSDILLNPTNFDGITMRLDAEIGFTQTFTKVADNSFPVKFTVPAGKKLYFNNAEVTSVQSVSRGAKCESIDIGGGNKVLSPLSGVWTTT